MSVLVDDRSPVRDEDRMFTARLYFGAVLFGVGSGERFENRSEDPTPKSFLERVPWLRRRGSHGFEFDFDFVFAFAFAERLDFFFFDEGRKRRIMILFFLLYYWILYYWLLWGSHKPP